MIGPEDRPALELLESRLKAILPKEYQDRYQDLEPTPMGSAGLKYGADGQVAWNEIWTTFCDLAMAGGPPHKGRLLMPASRADIDAEPDRYGEVVDEITRGISMVTDLAADRSPHPGWVRVWCYTEAMAQWLLRAIAMENVAVRLEGRALDLPASPHFRIEKEIKNVVTVMAKTCHYWVGHMSRAQQRAIGYLFARMAQEAALVVPAWSDPAMPDARLATASAQLSERINREVGLQTPAPGAAGWLGVECADIRVAVWMMRAMVVNNVLSRREGVVLFVPVNPITDPAGDRVVQTLALVHRLAAARHFPG